MYAVQELVSRERCIQVITCLLNLWLVICYQQMTKPLHFGYQFATFLSIILIFTICDIGTHISMFRNVIKYIFHVTSLILWHH